MAVDSSRRRQQKDRHDNGRTKDRSSRQLMARKEVMITQELIKTDNVSVRVKRLDLDASTDWHYHSDVTDYFVCLSGVVQVEAKNPDEVVILHPGQRVGIKHHQPHRIVNTHDNESEYLLIQGVGKYDFKKVS